MKTAVPCNLFTDRGSNIVVINPGSANIRIGLAQQDTPFDIPHCISHRTIQLPKRNVQDQMLNSQATTAQHMEQERAYDIIASVLRIPFFYEEAANSSYPRKIGRVDTHPPQNNMKEPVFTWTDVLEKNVPHSSITEEDATNEGSASESPTLKECKIKYICGEEALRISPTEPYCLRRPIRRGHRNISQHYPTQQVLEDLHTIWDWILVEKLHIPRHERNMYSVILVIPETFDNREIKEMLSIVLCDLHFGSAVVHQEGLAAVFGNGLSTACIVNIGAQVTSVICVEDGVALPTTQISLRFGGEDISRCLLWTQRHHQTWPPIRTDALSKPVDLLMLNRLKESYCQINYEFDASFHEHISSIQEGEVEAVATVHSYEDGMPPGSHKTRLTALNVPPMGLFYPTLLVPDVYPLPPRSWFSDYDDMLEDTWHMDFPGGGAYPMWESFPIFQSKPKKEDIIGLAEAITKSILLTGRINLQRKLFCSMQLIGGAASTCGLIPAVEERVLHAIPSHEAIDTVMPSRTNPAFVSRKGGAGSLDSWRGLDRNGIHVGSGRKYKDSYYVQAQAMGYLNS
ncbi:unnamed protein product [Withania somnifera]